MCTCRTHRTVTHGWAFEARPCPSSKMLIFISADSPVIRHSIILLRLTSACLCHTWWCGMLRGGYKAQRTHTARWHLTGGLGRLDAHWRRTALVDRGRLVCSGVAAATRRKGKGWRGSVGKWTANKMIQNPITWEVILASRLDYYWVFKYKTRGKRKGTFICMVSLLVLLQGKWWRNEISRTE